MTTGITALEKTLIGVEPTAGSGTPTTYWRGVAKIRDRRETVFPPERVGKFGGTNRSYVPRTGSEVPLDADATYTNLCYIFNGGIYRTTPTTDAGSSQIRAWTVQQSSSDLYATTDLDTLVVESGDNIGVEVANYVFIREFTLSGKQGEGLQISAIGQGRAPTTSASFTAVGDTDLDNPAETILFSKGLLYVDPSSDAAGTTPLTETLLDMSLKMTTGWVPIEAKDGRTDLSSLKRIDDSIMLDIAFEHNSVAETEKSAWKNQTERVLRLKFTGNALTTTDTYDTSTFIMDLYGKWQTFGAEGLEEQNGDNIYRGTFRVGYSTIAANKAVFTVVNELSALP